MYEISIKHKDKGRVSYKIYTKEEADAKEEKKKDEPAPKEEKKKGPSLDDIRGKIFG